MKTAHFDLTLDETVRAVIDRRFADDRRMKDVPGRAGVTRAADRIAAALGVVEGMARRTVGAPRDTALREREGFGRARRIEDRLAAMRRELGGRD